ncbi:hypothetical protein Q3G72_024649 [Acer saccharum]|nr:hypothetical protein Q3G72_024649 [Acer saccharum]
MALMKLSPLTLSTAHQKLSCFGEPQMPRSLRSPPIKLSIRASISKVCVYCGSNSGTRQVYTDAALDLGAQLVEKKVGLVYGGGNIGLMGLVSQTVYDGGCHVLGIIPGALIPVEIKEETSKHTVGELLIVSDMHERKAEMARRADAFIALPGVEEGFIKPSSRNILISANNAQQLLHRMEEYTLMHDQVASSQSWNV